MRALIVAAAVIGASATAHARPSRPFQLELTAGFRAGGNGTVGEGRLLAAWAHHVSTTERRSWFVAAGFEGTLGEISFDDPRGVDGELTAPRRTYGPTVRTGLAWSTSSWPAAYVFASATGLVADTRTDSLMLVESGRSLGARFAVGVSAPGSYKAIMEESTKGSCDGGTCGLGLLLALAPNTLEISSETLFAGGAVVQRYGVGIGWSL